MKTWIQRLTTLEQKAISLRIDDQLDHWIKEHVQKPDFLYFDIMLDVPDHLKMICLDKAMKQLKEIRDAKSSI